MNLDQFINWANGQSLLYAPSSAREYLRGQCVQPICFYVEKVWALPVIWVADAADWFAPQYFPQHYDRIRNNPGDPNQVPPRGAVMVWDKTLPGSGGSGHIAIVVDARPGSATFVSQDSNWGGKTSHLVTHNWGNVLGWIVPKSTAGTAPVTPVATAQAAQGDEMIANTDQATKAYKMLRPNGGATQGEIDATAGKRTFANFLNDAQGELNQRDAALRAQSEQLGTIQNIVNDQNATITKLTQDIRSSELSGQEKSQALADALQKLGEQNSELASAHDNVITLSNQVAGYHNNPIIKAQEKAAALAKKPGAFAVLLAKLMSIFPKPKVK